MTVLSQSPWKSRVTCYSKSLTFPDIHGHHRFLCIRHPIGHLTLLSHSPFHRVSTLLPGKRTSRTIVVTERVLPETIQLRTSNVFHSPHPLQPANVFFFSIITGQTPQHIIAVLPAGSLLGTLAVTQLADHINRKDNHVVWFNLGVRIDSPMYIYRTSPPPNWFLKMFITNLSI